MKQTVVVSEELMRDGEGRGSAERGGLEEVFDPGLKGSAYSSGGPGLTHTFPHYSANRTFQATG